MAPLAPSQDNCTLSNYHEVRSVHFDLDWHVDWNAKIISGSVTHTLKTETAAKSSQISFDTSYLDIRRVTDDSTARELEYDVEPRNKFLGSRLNVYLNAPLASYHGKDIRIKIDYSTTSSCTALGWLSPEQTASGKHPFLYSQCQAIHARSLLPCFDTPAVKATYSATVSSNLLILMSARRVSPGTHDKQLPVDRSTERKYTFDQPVRIPSYLVAIVGGELEFGELGPRTGIWAQPSVLKDAIWEFKEDMERFLDEAEKILVPYVWGRYDCLILPSSFPYGGMENSNLVTLTPALLVGDRSEVDVVAHELSHMWFGDLLSCANWDSFWLNEGWTVYMERLLVRALHGERARSLEYFMAASALRADLERQGKNSPRFQRLHIPYEKEDPDEGYSIIPYEKGSAFLLYLERTVGGLDVFLPYVQSYVKRFSDQSLTTRDWLTHFWEYWSALPDIEAKLRKEVDFDEWLNGEGVDLPVEMEFDTSLADASLALAGRWNASRGEADTRAQEFRKEDLAKFSARQVSLFLDTLASFDPFTRVEIDLMDRKYSFETSRNQEHKLRWYTLALRAGQRAPEAAQWLREGMGRMKYCRPIYRLLNEVDRDLARDTFMEHGVSFLHPIAKAMVAKDLGIDV